MGRVRLLFGCVVFVAAFLLFLVEPMAAKQLLPVLGGSAAVWITALVFFQTALLLGYLYAHRLSRRPRWNLHFLLLAAATISAFAWASHPLEGVQSTEHPFLTVFGALSGSIGMPFLMLAATSPLLQVWWSRLQSGEIPYRLYALSNLASLLALILYPALIEPELTLRAQRVVWCCGFAVFATLSAVLSRKTQLANDVSVAPVTEEEAAPSAPTMHKVLWVLLPMGGAMQLSAVTSYLTANVAAIPLLWVLPLAVYLLTLILAFQFPGLLKRGLLARFLVVMLGGLGYMLSHVEVSLPMRISIGFFLVEVFAACLFCHAKAYELRPKRTSESTLFYLLFAAGGALGSCLIGVVSPLVFSFNYDLPLTFFVTALLALVSTWRGGWNQRLLWGAATVGMVAIVLMVRIAYGHGTTVAVRDFYGSLRVKQDYSYPGATVRTLLNGSIQHGDQIFGSDALRHTPTTYYGQDSGIAYAMRFCCTGHARNIGVIGLGVGTIAAYGRPGDHITYYEIDPAVTPIARNVFTYIRDSGAQVRIVEGDARNSLAHEDPQHFDLLVVDAFSGDAIPLHLLTAEALALYRRHLAPGGVLAFHISNQHVDLDPPIARLAASAGMSARRVANGSNDSVGEFGSTWILLADNPAWFQQPELAAHSTALHLRSGLRLWTDDYSSLVPVIRW